MTPSTVACVVAISFPISILLPSVCLDDSIAGPLVDRLRPDGRSFDLVGQVRGKRAVGRLGRDQPQVRAYAGEQVGTAAEEDGRDVQADLVDEPGVEVLAIHVGAALDLHVLFAGGP